jgi:hypothetical protein
MVHQHPEPNQGGLEGVEALEDIDHSQVQEDLERSPAEKRNREQSVTGDDVGMTERQHDKPRADTRPPA